MSATRRSAQASAQYAQWLGETHPQLYQALFAQAINSGASARRKTHLRGLGDVGDDFGLSDFTPDLQDIQIDTGNLDYVESSSMSDIADALPLFDLSSSSISAQTGSGPTAASGGGGITGAIGSVGNWITSAQGLNAVANLGTAVLGAVATTQIAKAQMAVVQANAQRAQQGLSPVPISYVQGANGQMIPVYNTGNGTNILPSSLQQAINGGYSQPVTLPDGSLGYTVPSSTLSSLLGSNSIWLILGALALGLTLIAGSNV